MRLARIHELIYGEPWLVPASTHAAFRTLLDAFAAGAPVPAETFTPNSGFYQRPSDRSAAVNGVPAKDGLPPFDMVGDVAVIHIEGPIGKRLTSFEKACYGACDVDDVRKALNAAVDGKNAGVVLSFDSPGGTVTGTPELAADIRAACSKKKIYAYTDTLCASAAYWLASQTMGIFASPSASVGSIGVYSYFLDESASYAAQGLRPHLITTGKYKGMGAPGIPLTDDQRAHLQERVDAIFADFKAGVLDARPQADETVFDGRCFSGKDAIKHGLIDDICGSVGELVRDAFSD